MTIWDVYNVEGTQSTESLGIRRFGIGRENGREKVPIAGTNNSGSTNLRLFCAFILLIRNALFNHHFLPVAVYLVVVIIAIYLV
jgi:hypothetical protein